MSSKDIDNTPARDPREGSQLCPEETTKLSMGEVAKSSPLSSAHEVGPWIAYYREWWDKGNISIRRLKVDKSNIDMPSVEQEPSNDIPAFERVSVFRTKADPRSNANMNINFDSHHKSNANEHLTGPSSKTESFLKHYIRIRSTAIINALRSVVQYYPQQNLSDNVVNIDWPYPVLVHHYDELATLRDEYSTKQPEELCVREMGIDKQLSLLLGFLDEEVMDMVNVEKERNKRGSFTFDYMWVSMRPGFTVLSQNVERQEKGDMSAQVIHSLSGGIFSQPRQEWHRTGWSLDYNGNYLGRVRRVTTIREFSGEAAFTDWKLIFVGDRKEFYKAKEQEAIRRAIDEGKMYWDLINKRCMHHDGMIIDVLKNEVQGLVMIDLNSYYSRLLQKSRESRSSNSLPVLMGDADKGEFISDCPCHICDNRRRTKSKRTLIFAGYDKITRIHRERLTDHQYFLCPKQIPAFFFRTRTWENVYIRNLSPPRFQQKMIQSLVMDEGKLKTVRSLTKSFARVDRHGNKLSAVPWAADYVDGKGNGLIFLLHGGPGVGKTFTAECIANLLERPLMILTTTDIGTDPKTVEENLTRNFKTAKSWNAILLIDEADVFVANRTIKDLHRSSLVASFLRALEFYDGVLFLTTNRVGTFDDAILSRVHVQLFYPDLDFEQRFLVWKTFINKLEAEKPSIQVKYAVQEYLRSNEMKELEMNGREIRNAFQNAVALAEHAAEPGPGNTTLLTEDHLREVIELHRSFKKYFTNLHGPEGKRAYNRGERLDSFLSALEDSL